MKSKRGAKKTGKSKKSRPNHVTLQNGRRLTPESCTVPQAAALMSADRKAKHDHKRKPKRDANCTIQSAQLKLHDGGHVRAGHPPTSVHPRTSDSSSEVDDWWTPTGF